MENRRSPRVLFRLATCLAVWLVVSSIYAMSADLHIENGAEMEERVKSVLFAPFFGSLGLSHAVSGNPRPLPMVCYLCLAVLLAVSVGVVAAKSARQFISLAAAQAALVAWGFIGMSRLIDYWNLHGSG